MFLRRFLADETAAVTVDWVVLAAATVGFGLASVAAVRSGVVSLGSGIEDSLAGASVASLSGAPEAGGGILAGVGTPDCDWYCNFARFHEAENGPYDPDEWGPDVNVWADQRVAELQNYPTPFLQSMLTNDYLAWLTPENTPEPYYSYYMAERQVIANIIAERGG